VTRVRNHLTVEERADEMAIRRGNGFGMKTSPPPHKFGKGDFVHSRAFGSHPAFDGTIVFVGETGSGEPFFHVRDGNNELWHRGRSDIRLIRAAQ
jgi:hypothetical protein